MLNSSKSASSVHPLAVWLVPLLAASTAAGAWLPFLSDPLTPDEGGFLLLARQWAPGTSLYGDYWVDRPPLLIWLFSLCSGATAVWLLGVGAAVLTVLLAGVLARTVAPESPWAAWGAPVLAAIFVASPLFGMPETDGELLALPFVMTSLLCAVAALRSRPRRSTWVAAAAAGGTAMAAMLVKQNVVDAFVFAAVAFAVGWRRIDRPLARAATFVGGSLVVLALALAAAAQRGTSPAGLWDAVVGFRFQAWSVIDASAPAKTGDHFVRELAAFVASGAAVILATTSWTAWRRARGNGDRRVARLIVPASVMVGWELVSVCAGGSYWLHYLVELVPGLVLFAALAGPSVRTRSLLTAWLVFALVVSGGAWVHRQVNPPKLDDDVRAASYLRAHAKPSDRVIAAFGHPNIVQASGLQSPYPDLWILPTRVHDPDLVRFRHLINGPSAPRWLVVDAEPTDWWGLGRTEAVRESIRRRYQERAVYGIWHVVERRP